MTDMCHLVNCAKSIKTLTCDLLSKELFHGIAMLKGICTVCKIPTFLKINKHILEFR